MLLHRRATRIDTWTRRPDHRAHEGPPHLTGSTRAAWREQRPGRGCPPLWVVTTGADPHHEDRCARSGEPQRRWAAPDAVRGAGARALDARARHYAGRHAMRKRTRFPVVAAALLLGFAATTTAFTADPAAAARGLAKRGSPHHLYSGLHHTVPAGETGIGTASCPRGEVATGGGQFNYDYDVPDMVTTGSYGGGDYWVSQAHNYDLGSRGTDTYAVVICSAAPHAVVWEPEVQGVELGPWQTAAHTVQCPGDQVPSSGGPRTSNGEIYTNNSYRTGNGWTVTATNTNASHSNHFWVNIICSTVTHPVFTGPTEMVAPGKSGSAHAFCPEDQVLTGGGAKTGGDRDMYVRDTYPSVFENRLNRVDVRAVNYGATPQPLTAQAMCTLL
ncbi:hypothetical protein OG948_37790 (plasmid) [Embleya sp. NBC_00888]|uniref:hypothetical protein n=1 Tax=Embleya sp. NBC_00888 TaxID=2975960 RepID=UPI002F908598|nr:hypothetical protein OG948_37790 [Embleya sp. NBC_00888]